MTGLVEFQFDGQEPPRPGESYLYLVEILGMGVKVGVSTRPAHRLNQHRRDAEAFGRGIGRVWVSDVPHANAHENERTIKGDSPREYLARPFDECLAETEALRYSRVEDVHPLDQPVNQFLSALHPGFGEFLEREYAR